MIRNEVIDEILFYLLLEYFQNLGQIKDNLIKKMFVLKSKAFCQMLNHLRSNVCYSTF